MKLLPGITERVGLFGSFIQSLSSIGPMLNIIGLFAIIASIDANQLLYIVLLSFIFASFNVYMPYRASKLFRSNGGYYTVSGIKLGKKSGLLTSYLYIIYGFSTFPSVTLFVISFLGFLSLNPVIISLFAIIYSLVAVLVISRGFGRTMYVMKALGMFEVVFIIFADILMILHPHSTISPMNLADLSSLKIWEGILFGLLMFAGSGSAFFISENTENSKRSVPRGIILAFVVSGFLMVLSAYSVQVFVGNKMGLYLLNPYVILYFIKSEFGLIPYYLFLVLSISSSFNLTVSYLNSFRNAFDKMREDNIVHFKKVTLYFVILAVNVIISLLSYFTIGAFLGFVIVSGIVSMTFLIVHIIPSFGLELDTIKSRKAFPFTIMLISLSMLTLTLIYSFVGNLKSNSYIDASFIFIIAASVLIIFSKRNILNDITFDAGDIKE